MELYEIGPGTTTTEAFRAIYGPPAFFGEFNTLFSDDSEWLNLAADLWTLAKTPTQTISIQAGAPIPLIHLPAYGAVYARIIPNP